MKLQTILIHSVFGLLITASASAREVLTGDTRLACEAILCLSTSKRPTECAPSLARYFGISFKRWSDTVKGRTDFLDLCPAANADSNMQKLVNAIGNGAGRCDAAALNSTLVIDFGADGRPGVISDVMPDYCAAYVTNPYADLQTAQPLYVGNPDRGGYWVEASEYVQALKDYQTRIDAEDAARQQSFSGG